MPRTTASKKSSRAGGKGGASTRSRSRARKGVKPERLTDYGAALEHLAGRANLERMRASRAGEVDMRLDRVRAALTALDNPQESLACVQIVGTKGKGSTAAMLASALEASGCAVGQFTSPHLVDVRERISVGGAPISQAGFVEAMNHCLAAEARLPKKLGRLTYFEALTVMALRWFAEEAVDVAVLECGLGGRLDATSAVTPLVVCATAISLDHTHILGGTLGEIAAEKAGAFKPGVPVITVPQEKEARRALKARAAEVGAPYLTLGRDIEFSQRFEVSPRLGAHTCVCLSTERSSFEHVPAPLMGEHQALNCGLALAAWDQLRAVGLNLREEQAIEGLARTKLPGRMELVRDAPRILLDGAHNVASMRALIRAIGSYMPYDSMVMIFGCSEDKDVDGLLREVALGADKVVFTRARSSPRAVEPEALRDRFASAHGRMAQTAPSLREALDLAVRAVGRGDLVCVAGSFYLVGEAKRLFDASADGAQARP